MGLSNQPNDMMPHDMFSVALSELDVDKKARDAGVRELPDTHSTDLDANERAFVGYFSTKLREERVKTDSSLTKLSLDRKATAAKIDVTQTRLSLSSIFNGIEPDLVRLRQDHRQDLENAKEQEARSLRYLRYFQQENGLHDRAAEDRPEPLHHFAIILVFAVLEWVALSVFYAEGSDFGLLGGIILAMGLSLINIVLAVTIGILLRYVNHRSAGRKGLALIGALVLATVFLFATGFAAHYRIATKELAQASTQIESKANDSRQTTQPSQGLSRGINKPYIPAAIVPEDDQWKASKLAWQNFRENGFLFSDVLSWILVILAIMFGIIAGWKGFRIDDPYPGYGSIWRKYEEHRHAYESAKKFHTESVNQIFMNASRAQKELMASVRREIDFFKDLVGKSESEALRFEKFSGEAAQACNDIVLRYRQKNREVAVEKAPAYFADSVGLEPSLTHPLEALTGDDRILLESYNEAISEFAKVIQTDDERTQALRATHLNQLGAFFEEIERAIAIRLKKQSNPELA